MAEERQPLTVMTLDLYTLNIPIIIVIILFYMEIFNISILFCLLPFVCILNIVIVPVDWFLELTL